MVKLKKITWYENKLEDGTSIITAVVRPGGDVYNSTKIGDVRVYYGGTIMAHSDILKGYNVYRTSVSRYSVEEGKAFICKTFRDAMKLIVEGEVATHKDDIVESDDYVPTNWLSGDIEFDKELTKKAKQFKEDMKSKDIKVLESAAKAWKEVKNGEGFPRDYKIAKKVNECIEDWFIECYHTIEDVNELVSYTFYYN